MLFNRPPEDAIALLAGMVQIDTISDALSGRSGSEQGLIEALERLVGTWGLAARRLPVPDHADQLLVTLTGQKADQWRVFDHHLDTVGIEGMSIDPFGGEARDGKLYGRGACDTKGTGAAALWALREVHLASESAGPPPSSIAVLFTVDEEVSMAGVRHFVQQQLAAALPGTIDGVIVGEPTRNLPITAHHGLVRWELTTSGKAAHSSIPALGDNAIAPMLKLLQAVQNEYIPSLSASHPRCGKAASSITMLHAGQSPNVIPDACRASIDRRLTPGETADDADADLRAVLERTGVPYELRAAVWHPPMSDAHCDAWIKTVVQTLNDCDLPSQTLGVPFCTHGSYWSEAGIPALVLGPGDALAAHTHDESIDLGAVNEGVKIYRALMASSD